MTSVFLGLGGNLDGTRAAMREAVERMHRWPNTVVVGVSSLYRTAYVGPGEAQPDYWNACVELITSLSAEDVLEHSLALEDQAGRRRSRPNAPRRLDVDLLLFGAVTVDQPGLQIPHPRLRQRRFVLEPLRELHPDLTLPPDGMAAAELLRGPSVREQEASRVEDPAWMESTVS